MDEAKNISGILNPNSVAQLKKYLNHTGSLDKKAVMEKLKTATGTEKRILEIRQILGQSAVKKYQALANAVCKDNRVRGTMLFYGAHTGRWSGRLFQPQNLPRVKPVDPVFGRALVKAEDVDSINR
jgi:DNA polymerase